LLLLVTPAMANAQNTWMYYNSSSHESGPITVTQSTPNQLVTALLTPINLSPLT